MSNYTGQQTTGRIEFSQQSANGKKLLSVLTAGLFVIIILTILQDLIHSRVNDYFFYFSESLLFKTFWFLFPPLLFFQSKYLSKVKTKTILRPLSAIAAPTLTHLLLTPLVIFAVSAVFYAHTFSYYQTFAYTISEDFYKLPLIYGISFFLFNYIFNGAKPIAEKINKLSVESVESFDAEKTELKVDEQVQPAELEIIVVSIGRKYVPISVSDILYISAATPYVAIHLENRRFLHNETLRSINKKLNAAQFVRIHKSTIVNVDKIVSYKSRLNGDYDVLLENGNEIRLSRNYSAEFKKHFDGCPQVER